MGYTHEAGAELLSNECLDDCSAQSKSVLPDTIMNVGQDLAAHPEVLGITQRC